MDWIWLKKIINDLFKINDEKKYKFRAKNACIFADFRYEEITQIPKMNVYDLVGSVGGTLGVFIGFQILSLLEILEFLLHVLIILLN